MIYVGIFGIIMGILASIVNQNKSFDPTFIGPLAITYGYWVILGMFVVLKSKTAKLAGVNCFIFFVLMNISFYLYEYFITSIFQSNWLLKWLVMSLFTLIGGYIMWYWKSSKKWAWFLFIFPLFFLGEEVINTIISLRFDQLIYEDGIGILVPMNTYFIINKLIIVIIYVLFLMYLLIYRKKRLK